MEIKIKLLAILALAFLVILDSFVVADNIIPAYIRGRGAETTYDFTFNFTSDSSCNDVLKSVETQITTDINGIGFASLDISDLLIPPSYMCEYQDNVLIAVHNWNDIIVKHITAKNINTSSLSSNDGTLEINSNVDLGNNSIINVSSYNTLSIMPSDDWIYLSGDGSIESGFDISIPKYAGRHFYYGYGGGAENHYFGNAGALTIASNGNLITNIGTFDIVITGGSGIKILDDIAETYYLSLRVGQMGSALTANRLLKFDVQDTNRIITLSGNPTLGDWFDQPVKRNSNPTFNNLLVDGNIGMDSGGVWTNTLIIIEGTTMGVTSDPYLINFVNGIFEIDGDFDVTGNISDISTPSISTDGNEKIAFDVVRHTITSDEEDDDYFYEEWIKATPSEIVSLDLVLWVSVDNEVFDVSNYYSSYPTVFDMEVKISTDESEELYVTSDGDYWVEGDVVTIFISYLN